MKKYFLLYLIIIIVLLLFVLLLKKLYRPIIDKYENKKIVIHKRLLRDKQELKWFIPGLGDFFKGTFSLYNISKRNGYTFYIDISEHPIGKYIINTTPYKYTNLPNKTNEFFFYYNVQTHNELINKVDEFMKVEDIGVFETNLEPEINNELDNNDMLTIQKLFIPNDYLQDKINNIKLQLKLDNYSVLHIRTGDKNINKGLDSKIVNSVEEILNKIKLTENTLLLSDSSELKLYLIKKYNFKILESEIIHLGFLESNNIDNGIESTLIDFFLICGAKKIYSLSVYDWNSGFSTMASKVYVIPIEKYIIK
jgi:hypothetical protein